MIKCYGEISFDSYCGFIRIISYLNSVVVEVATHVSEPCLNLYNDHIRVDLELHFFYKTVPLFVWHFGLFCFKSLSLYYVYNRLSINVT